MKWNWNEKGGTCGTYELNGWKIFCDGSQFIIIKPNGNRIERNWKTLETAQRNAEKMMVKQ